MFTSKNIHYLTVPIFENIPNLQISKYISVQRVYFLFFFFSKKKSVTAYRVTTRAADKARPRDTARSAHNRQEIISRGGSKIFAANSSAFRFLAGLGNEGNDECIPSPSHPTLLPFFPLLLFPSSGLPLSASSKETQAWKRRPIERFHASAVVVCAAKMSPAIVCYAGIVDFLFSTVLFHRGLWCSFLASLIPRLVSSFPSWRTGWWRRRSERSFPSHKSSRARWSVMVDTQTGEIAVPRGNLSPRWNSPGIGCRNWAIEVPPFVSFSSLSSR